MADSVAKLTHIALRAATSTTSAASSATATSSSSASTTSRPPVYHVVGIILAISSGLFIGVSFVIKKVGLLKANKKYHEEAGEGYGYLKNAWWWLGMTLMIIGEICNFVAYAFVDAILVTPMGSLSVVISTILSSIFLKERLSFVGWVGCFLCIVGSIVIVLNAPQNSAVADIQEMQHYVIAPGFLTYAAVIIVGCFFIAWWAGPRYGKKSMLVYISICSLIGGLSVVATQGLGAAIVAQIAGTEQFNQWFLYVLFVFVICTLVTEIIFLNKALNIFNASIVTPTYYVYFTSSTIVSSAILFQGLHGSAMQLTTMVLGFLVICSGVILLQLSKSAKDVPDTAVFNGDLDQIRTLAEVEAPESEPKADAIRGSAAILRSMSKSRLRKEAEEAERIKQEWLEPIGEDEQVEWDGLRRRKTVLAPGQTSLRRQKTVHPPLGMTHFPDEDSDNESRRPEDDHGMFPNFRKRASTMLSQRSRRNTTSTQGSDPIKFGVTTGTVPLATMYSGNRTYSQNPDGSYDDENADLTNQGKAFYGLPDDLKRATSIGLSGLADQDTSYHPDAGSPTIAWAPEPSHTGGLPPPAARGQASTPGPTPPPHGRSHEHTGKRQFSFQNVFHHPTSPGPLAVDNDNRPVSGKSQSSFGSRVFSSIRKSSGPAGGPTEEERLGLVKGDTSTGRFPADLSPAREAKHEGEDDGREPGMGKTSRGRRDEDDDEEYEETGYSDSPERISSTESGEYAKVRRKDSDDDNFGAGGAAQGAAFV